MVIDRFYSYTMKLSGGISRRSLITAAWDSNDDVMPCTKAYYEKLLCRYMNFSDQGMILGTGCGSPAMTRSSRHMQDAYALGKSL